MRKLTEKEKQILEYLAEGFSNKEIAPRLGVSEQTVKNWLGKIYLKLGVEGRVQAIMRWRQGWRKRLLTVNEVADMLRVHPNTVREWERHGMLEAYRLGGRRDRRFDPEEVEAFLRRR